MQACNTPRTRIGAVAFYNKAMLQNCTKTIEREQWAGSLPKLPVHPLDLSPLELVQEQFDYQSNSNVSRLQVYTHVPNIPKK